jgi:hypothetical protein
VIAGAGTTTWSVTRGTNGTEVQAHNSGSSVSYVAQVGGFMAGLIDADVDTFIVQSLNPSENALLYMTHTKREGLTDIGGATVFREVFRQITTFQYDREQKIACENTSTQEFDEDLNTWEIVKHDSRFHSETTGGAIRTTRLSYVFEDSKYKISSSDVQQVGGSRPSVNNASGRRTVLTFQAQAPQGELDGLGNPLDPGEGFYTWTYENPYIGQTVCDQLYALALAEQQAQLSGIKWEIINFDGILNPNVGVTRSVSIEREDETFADYLIEDVAHDFGTDFAGTKGTAKRLTTEDLS